MTKHSKAPWRRGASYGTLKTEVLDADGNTFVAAVQTSRFDTKGRDAQPYPEGEANLRLVLAAPALLEALERMVEVYEAHFEPLPDGQQPEGAYTQARAAIAAASADEGDG